VLAQRLLLGDKIADVRQRLAIRRFPSVAHCASVPDLGRCAGLDSVGCISPEARTSS
jgi:hypothetical protein